MSEIYRVFFNTNIENNGVGYVIEGDVHFRLPNEGKVNDWKPMVLEVRDGEFCDYLASNMGLRVCSEKLRNIIDEKASEYDVLQWLAIYAERKVEKEPYYILHLPQPPDVLNMEQTLYGKNYDMVIKPVLSRVLSDRYNIITYPGTMGLIWFVRDFVKKAIQAAGCTGIEFSQARVV